MLDKQTIEAIEKAIESGSTVEVKKEKDNLVVVEKTERRRIIAKAKIKAKVGAVE